MTENPRDNFADDSTVPWCPPVLGYRNRATKIAEEPVTGNLLGTWKWHTGATVKFTRDDTTIIDLASGKRVNPGAWRFNADDATIDIVRGEVTDRANLACNVRMLEGVVAIGRTKVDRMWAVKVGD